jgi:hypothetical protein
VLLLASLGAVGYLYVSRSGSSSSATGFVGADQESAKAVVTVRTAAQNVQRFKELHAFDVTARAQIQTLSRQLTKLESIAAGASGRQKQIADKAVTTVKEVIYGVGQYRKALASTYRLVDAAAAERGLDYAVANLKQQAQAWQHS